MLFKIKNLKVLYGKATALEDISLKVNEGEIVSIVGANGAGKTSVLRTISGLKKPAAGEIWFDDKRIDRIPAHGIVKTGIAMIPAGRMIFANMSVLDNIKIGAFLRKDTRKIKEDIESIYEHFPILKERQSQLGGQLSGGEQQMLAVARALMANPKLLLMDEPSTGLSPLLVTEVGNIIRDINRRQGISILLVEQNSHLALKLSRRAYILELGKIAMHGDSADLMNNETVKKYYLGKIEGSALDIGHN
jgi:branched-chain amino acid transport system ATP-binding protein